MELIDISMEITPRMAVYPGDPSPSLRVQNTLEESGAQLSTFLLGSHTGTHVDAPLHIRAGGATVADLPLESLHGPCVVLDLTSAGREIRASHLEMMDIPEDFIVLLKTENSLEQYDTFREDYAYIAMDAARHLVSRRVKTLGFDYLSVERFGGDMEVHRILVNSMTVFEGLYLKNVQPGRYLFSGLPLKVASDGSPARAVLIRSDP